ncbi:MAG: hypothetical protein COV55_01730 [Candidatus Komeilibacteria bacterium CG11_big_fil_rev_8_21_14_0_20_36_20]|uniref:Uncharacterized protein n=1 Tax=Candidatus Komeilibacteria bacterium CG11_big_fil_rev_8_21_14_0_20_36_20 TaxID=1974477 RepID=A0A2H0NE11_9BACT|nr:MAG: hypothetical protein COV55_01730 [Candidatus Komeilibacteria bacterium CG11_big_fil_rev_8_21_14_0_20_36_20]PIR81263.1 MAG: hypothetical protein COU21_04715 [Candidatus Komeilibacteria bacterium CG10_big_fil_rev_8_21_14_0_10_36_65]PJC55227.1 MAG: hypothetical protein CO027_03655 [Candidatus Komeilibacteria bacterium CG_4_9_14_0_2_um_filter_36_13]
MSLLTDKVFEIACTDIRKALEDDPTNSDVKATLIAIRDKSPGFRERIIEALKLTAPDLMRGNEMLVVNYEDDPIEILDRLIEEFKVEIAALPT